MPMSIRAVAPPAVVANPPPVAAEREAEETEIKTEKPRTEQEAVVVAAIVLEQVPCPLVMPPRNEFVASRVGMTLEARIVQENDMRIIQTLKQSQVPTLPARRMILLVARLQRAVPVLVEAPEAAIVLVAQKKKKPRTEPKAVVVAAIVLEQVLRPLVMPPRNEFVASRVGMTLEDVLMGHPHPGEPITETTGSTAYRVLTGPPRQSQHLTKVMLLRKPLRLTKKRLKKMLE
jgi:hypothetical protein